MTNLEQSPKTGFLETRFIDLPISEEIRTVSGSVLR